MQPSTKIILSLLILTVVLGALAAQIILVREITTRQPEYTSNAGELTRDVLVGQTFVSSRDNLSAVSIMLATYSGRSNTGLVKFHLRRSTEDREDIRTATAEAGRLGDNQFHRFEFEPIEGSAGQSYFFFVVSPDSQPGNAVTVDIDTRDPYHEGTAFLVRGQGSNVTDPGVLSRSGKQPIDLAFETYHTVPLREAIVNTITHAIRTFIATWDERQSLYTLWAKVSLPAMMFFIFLALVRKSLYSRLTEGWSERRLTVVMLGGLLLAALLFRLIWAGELPLTNDEGNYLYDARSLRQGFLAGGDGYVKAPLVIAWIAAWQMFFGDTVEAGRMASIVIGALTLYPIYFLGKELWGRRFGLMAAGIWAFFGAAIVFNIYVHTQPVALFLGTAGLATLAMALHGTVPRLTFVARQTVPARTAWFVAAGVLLGLGVASRKSILALGLVPLALILLEGKTWQLRIKHLVAVASGFLFVMAAFLGLGFWLYGSQGVWEALGVNSAEDGFNAVDPAEAEQVRAYSIRGLTPFFRESLPLILLSLLGFGLAAERLIRAGIRLLRYRPPRAFWWLLDHVVPKLGWVIAWLVFWWSWKFFQEYEGAMFMAFGIKELWYLFAAIMLLFTLLPRPRAEQLHWPGERPVVAASTQPSAWRLGGLLGLNRNQPLVRQQLAAILLVPLWIGGLIFFYLNWIKFHANYIAEFIVPLTLLASFGAIGLFERLRSSAFLRKDYPWLEVIRRMTVLGVAIVLLWAIIISNYITFVFEHTGTFQLKAVAEASDWARANIPLDQPIFTGAAVVPYLSGHHAALDIAHPRWYAYEFTRKDPERLNAFLPPAEDMVQAFREAEWFLQEQQTSFSFLMEYGEIERGLTEDFEQVKGISNGSNTLTFYRRVSPSR